MLVVGLGEEVSGLFLFHWFFYPSLCLLLYFKYFKYTQKKRREEEGEEGEEGRGGVRREEGEEEGEGEEEEEERGEEKPLGLRHPHHFSFREFLFKKKNKKKKKKIEEVDQPEQLLLYAELLFGPLG